MVETFKIVKDIFVEITFQVDIWEALQVPRPNTPGFNPDEEEKALQR